MQSRISAEELRCVFHEYLKEKEKLKEKSDASVDDSDMEVEDSKDVSDDSVHGDDDGKMDNAGSVVMCDEGVEDGVEV